VLLASIPPFLRLADWSEWRRRRGPGGDATTRSRKIHHERLFVAITEAPDSGPTGPSPSGALIASSATASRCAASRQGKTPARPARARSRRGFRRHVLRSMPIAEKGCISHAVRRSDGRSRREHDGQADQVRGSCGVSLMLRRFGKDRGWVESYLLEGANGAPIMTEHTTKICHAAA
jgi:hypothetical protein